MKTIAEGIRMSNLSNLATVSPTTRQGQAGLLYTEQDVSFGDATWILTSAFIIFTMQSGFGLIESGMVTVKNETNIMVKNAIDIIFSGFSFWLVGFGLSFGTDEGTNAFTGVGYFLTEVPLKEGQIYAMYFFQMALASTATTIVSGAMAERTNLRAYMLYSFVSTLTTCFPAHWIWGKGGFLREMGVVDIAGCSGIHLVGGAAGLAAALILGPRHGRYDQGRKRPQPCSMTNVLLGMFMLWWGWLGFNCGSTFGLSGGKWIIASRTAVVTLNGSVGGGMLGILYSYIRDPETLSVPIFVTGIRGGLVGVTGICAVCRPWEGILIGFFGGLFACLLSDLMNRVKIDDPVNCVATHAGSGIWGMIAVAFFVEKDNLEGFTRANGIFKGGSWHILGAQLCAIVVTGTWGVVTTLIQLFVIEKTIGIRLKLEEELLGCDLVEHGIGKRNEIPESLNTVENNIEVENQEKEAVDERSCQSAEFVGEHVKMDYNTSHSAIDDSQDFKELLLQELENTSPRQARSRTNQECHTVDKAVQVYLSKLTE